MSTEIDLTEIDEAKQALVELAEVLAIAGDFDGLHELLIVFRNDEAYPDVLGRAMLAIDARGRDSGRAEVMKSVMNCVVANADETIAN